MGTEIESARRPGTVGHRFGPPIRRGRDGGQSVTILVGARWRHHRAEGVAGRLREHGRADVSGAQHGIRAARQPQSRGIGRIAPRQRGPRRRAVGWGHQPAVSKDPGELVRGSTRGRQPAVIAIGAPVKGAHPRLAGPAARGEVIDAVLAIRAVEFQRLVQRLGRHRQRGGQQQAGPQKRKAFHSINYRSEPKPQRSRSEKLNKQAATVRPPAARCGPRPPPGGIPRCRAQA